MDLQQITTHKYYQECLPNHAIFDSCLYTSYSRHFLKDLPIRLVNLILSEAVKLNRYYNEYNIVLITGINKEIKEGTDPCIGPKDFSIEFLNNSPIGNISYETYLILPYLTTINNILDKYNIRTIQSQPSYYINLNVLNFETYFNIPFVEFTGSIDSIEIYKKIQANIKLSKCYFNIYFEKDKTTDDVNIRFCILRPFLDIDGNVNSGFDDTDFWLNIIEVIQELY